MEITKPLDLDETAIFTLEMHSFLNVLSVLSGILQYFQMQPGCDGYFDNPVQKIHALSDAVNANDKEHVSPQAIIELKEDILNSLNRFRTEQPEYGEGGEFEELTEPLDEVLAVLDVRVEELKSRSEDPEAWIFIDKDEYLHEFHHFFLAVQKNSLGRYRIIHNLADQRSNDYLVNLRIDSDLNGMIPLKILLKDVVRDVVSNARKYTPPGGKINVGISLSKGTLRFVCEDSGIGIPADEIEKVIGYTYRASNVDGKIRTMGNGSGLTKAWYVVQQLNGRMWIDSEVGSGTRITVEVPVPKTVLQQALSIAS